MIDTTNKERRYINTPDGKAQIDLFITGDTGQVERVTVWLGEYDPRATYPRPHALFDVRECEELQEVEK